MKYQKVGTTVPDEETGEIIRNDAVPIETVGGNQPSESNEKQEQYTLKVLHKEKVHTLLGLMEQSSVGQLKIEIEKVTSVEVADQRLIFSGKSLKPDDKTLAFFKVTSNSSIHLFPMPPRSERLVIASDTGLNPNDTDSNAAHMGIASINFALNPGMRNSNIAHYPIHFDPQVSMHSREVRLWSVILVFLCFMTLFNNISYNLSTGKFGKNSFDVIISVSDTVSYSKCSNHFLI